MNSDEALAVIRRIMSDKLGVDTASVVPGAHLRDDLGLDSLDAIDLLQSLGDVFGEWVGDTPLGSVATVADMVALALHGPPAAG